MKMVTELPCLSHSATDRESIVTSNESRTGLGFSIWQKPNKNTIRPLAFASRYFESRRENLFDRIPGSIGTGMEVEEFSFTTVR